MEGGGSHRIEAGGTEPGDAKDFGAHFCW
jgi:hypothetical protein